MTPKRIAGVLNLILAVVVGGLGISRHQPFLVFAAMILVLIGYLRLRR
jgi:hypothetical protein